MNNQDIVRDALLKKYSTVTVDRFMIFLQQDRLLSSMTDRDPQKAITLCLEVLRIAVGNVK